MANKDPGAQVQLIIWIALLLAHAIQFAMGQIVPKTGVPPETLELMAWILTGLGGAVALVSALGVPMLFRGQPYPTMFILRVAFADVPSIFGLLLAMMGAEMHWVYILTGLGVAAHLNAFPSQRDREAHAKT
jgi:hypothetical protein